jgi:hypothetical protein
MRATLQVSLAIFSLVALGTLIVGFFAHVLLTRHIDGGKVRAKTGASKFWLIGNPAAPMELYTGSGHSLWKLRYVCLKSFQIAAGLLAIVLFLFSRL